MTRKETLFSATLVPRAKHCNTDTMIIVFCRDHGKQRETTTPRKLARSFIESKPILSTQLSVTVQLLYLQWHGHKTSSQQHVNPVSLYNYCTCSGTATKLVPNSTRTEVLSLQQVLCN